MIAQTTQTVEQILQELIQAWNAHDAARVSSFYDPDYIGVDMSITEQQHGPEGVRRMVQHYLDVFPDLRITAEESIINQERAAIKLRINGTHRGVIMNIPATGRLTEIAGVAFMTFHAGKVQQASYLWDVAAFLRGIGLLPDL